MGARTVIELRSDKSPTRLLSDLVMAWAHDAETGEPRYILELGPGQRGARCGCTCVGCGEPLVAVNAAKSEFVRRPHFRHFEGVEHADCAVLAARAAALRQLQEDGWIELPRRRMSSQVEGLSGEFYEAWVERPSEKLRISQVDYRDHAAAVFTFEDGRTLRVELTGTVGADGSGLADPDATVAAILIRVEDPAIAAMSPEEVRRHLTLLPDALCWRSHWSDADLRQQAQDAAHNEAQLYLDHAPSDLVLPPDMEANRKRESVLHHVAKKILVEEGRVAVPGIRVDVEVPASGEILSLSWMLDSDVFILDHIELEASYGTIVPDLACKGYPEGGGRVYVPMFIEITVSNTIDKERLVRIRKKKCLALEIDLSLAGGRVTWDELRRLVIEELATKRWLYHPEGEESRDTLAAQLHAQADRKAAVLAMPMEVLAREYLDALLVKLRDDRDRELRDDSAGVGRGTAANEQLADAVDKFAIRGFPEAGASMLISAHGILDRILSIKHDEGIGYRLSSGHAVLNAVRQDRADDRAYHSLFLIAALTYEPRLSQEQRFKLDGWRADVRASIKAGELTYLRPPSFDRLLSVLFPEMAADLAKPGAKRDARRHGRAASTQWHETYARHTDRLIATQPRSDLASWPLKDTPPGGWWFKGRDLDEWKRRNPEWASMWGGRDVPAEENDVAPSMPVVNLYERRKG